MVAPRAVPRGGEHLAALGRGLAPGVLSSKKTPALCLARVLGHGSTPDMAAGKELRLARTVPRMGWPWGQR